MPEEPVIRLERTPPVATVTLSRPHALNAITREMLLQLQGALEGLAADDEVRVVVLTGEGRAFSAGVDLKAMREHPRPEGAVGGLLDEPARSVIRQLTTMPQVVIARVN